MNQEQNLVNLDAVIELNAIGGKVLGSVDVSSQP